MAYTPSVVFMSCSETQPDEIIKLILEVSELPEKIQINEDVYAFPWRIDNKYYKADVNLCSLKKKSICNEKFSESVQAIVLHFDSSKNDAIDKIESWLPFINEYSPEIKILLCQNAKDDDDEDTAGCSKRTILEWCVNKGFELVEIKPIVDEDVDELEDDFPETVGVKRIVQVLNAHVWPNLVMKTSEKLNAPRSLKEPGKSELNRLKNSLCLEESLDELLENDDDFSQLFSQFSEMKARVTSLPGQDRKAAAEQVVRAFWKALGGDEDDEF